MVRRQVANLENMNASIGVRRRSVQSKAHWANGWRKSDAGLDQRSSFDHARDVNLQERAEIAVLFYETALRIPRFELLGSHPRERNARPDSSMRTIHNLDYERTLWVDGNES